MNKVGEGEERGPQLVGGWSKTEITMFPGKIQLSAFEFHHKLDEKVI